MRSTIVTAAAAAAVLLSLPAAAQFQKPEDAIKYRQSAFTVMGNHFGRIGAMVQGKVPFDAKAAAENAALVHMLAPLPFTAFGPGTDKGAPTRAKAEVWTSTDFKDDAAKLATLTAKLADVAKGGNPDQLKAAFGEVGKTCKGCHDEYRAEKYSN